MATTPSRDDDHDYAAIEATLAATARGRRYLDERARRERAAETLNLLEAIARLERKVGGGVGLPGTERLALGAAEMRQEMDRLHAVTASGAERVSDRLGEVVREGEAAAAVVTDAAENIQEIAWTMREAGADPGICDRLDDRVTTIFAAMRACEIVFGTGAAVSRSLSLFEDRLKDLERPPAPALLHPNDIPVPARADDIAFRPIAPTSAMAPQGVPSPGSYIRFVNRGDDEPSRP